jgi:excinuclease ABC subunit B
LDADKEGFLRNRRSLTQTAGRAARNVHGRVIFYADKITGSMAQTIDETERRRQKQMEFNTLNGIEPTQIFKHKTSILRQASDIMEMKPRMYSEGDFSRPSIAADPVMSNWGEKEIQKAVVAAKRKMEKAAENLEFMEAAQFRDEMKALEERLIELNNQPL